MQALRERAICVAAELAQEKKRRQAWALQVDELARLLQERHEAAAALAEELHALASQQPRGGALGDRASSALYIADKVMAAASSSGVLHLRWEAEPLSLNLTLSSNRRAVRFTGANKDVDQGLKAFVGTEAPVWRDDGFGFEVVVQRCRAESTDGLAIGFCSVCPSSWPDDLPDSADELDACLWLVGYGGEMCERLEASSQWKTCRWSSSDLAPGDTLRVSMLLHGRLEVRVNSALVCVANVNYDANGPPLYGVVDLLGNVDAVMLVS